MNGDDFRSRFARLTPRQKEAMLCRFEGESNRACGERFYVSKDAIKGRVTGALKRLGVTGYEQGRIVQAARAYGRFVDSQNGDS